jgi:hypothetical protein
MIAYKSVSILRESWSGLPIAIRFQRGARMRTWKRWTWASYYRVMKLIAKRKAA